MYPVETRLPDDRLLVDCMTKAFDWLRCQGIWPKAFRYTFETPGVVFRVDFERVAEADAFAARFPGFAPRIVAGPHAVSAASAPRVAPCAT